jgi:2-oxoglutarate dehydrogenase E2 component (dihydrolipoamide succinyltransferase)
MSQSGAAEPLVAPAARRLVKELALDPAQIPGSGKDGRIQKADVVAYLDAHERAQPAVEPDSLPAAPQAPCLTGEAGRPEQRVTMTRLRARVAERLVQAQQTAAILTTFNEVNMQPVMDLRLKYRDQFEKTHGVRLGYMSFFVKAAVEALQRFPIVNASVDGQDIIYHGYYDIGIAVSSPRGLVVPILRNCDQLTMADVEQGVVEFGRKAKDGTLSFEELTGGTFSITNGGVFGSLVSTPILNPPQSAILGMHKIQERPIAEKGQVVIRPMMYLALSYDHRIIDGRDAVQFLVAIKDVLEDPARLLLRI